MPRKVKFLFLIVFLVGASVFFFHFKKEKQSQAVLGVEDDMSNRIVGEIKKGNAFSLDTTYASGFVPVRKSDYYDIKIWAGSSVAVDVESGTLLHYDNGRKRTQIASLTKVMTAILTMENIQNLKEEVVTITERAAYIPGTVVGCPRTGYCLSNRLYTGEKVSAYNLLKAMLINSANDAAFSLAVHMAGSEKEFVKKMNEKARSLGLKDTNFCTASGLETDGAEETCYSSAYDIARIAGEALKYDLIWEIMRISEDRFYSVDGKYMHELKNTDILIEQLPNCIGGKTGFTPLAGKSLMFAANDPTGKHRVVMVILDDPNRFEDMKFLNSWIFENYEWK